MDVECVEQAVKLSVNLCFIATSLFKPAAHLFALAIGYTIMFLSQMPGSQLLAANDPRRTTR
jgi:hypothetical protein